MAKAPADRYQSAAAMLADLRAVGGQWSAPESDPFATRSAVRPATALAPIAPATKVAAPARKWTARRVRACLASGLIALAAGIVILTSKLAVNDASQVNAAPPGEPVLVGVLHSMSGTMEASESGVVDAVLFAIDEVNQAGGVLGRPVKGVVADGRSDWPTFAREAERLIVQDKVVTVFGCWTSASRKAVKPIFEAHDHLLIYPVQFEGLETSPCIVYLGAAPISKSCPPSNGLRKRGR